jgi:alanine racemase
LDGSICVDEEGELKYPVPEVNVLEINLSQLRKNFEIVKGYLKPQTKLLAILKGNAYGHGLIAAAHELEHCRCAAFGVVRLNEAYALRVAGIKTQIMLLAPTLPSQASILLQYEITPMVDNLEFANAIEQECRKRDRKFPVHIKVNTGLNRFGVGVDEAVDFVQIIQKDYPHIIIEGIYSHFQNPDYNPDFTKEQTNRFLTIIQKLEAMNIRPPVVHIANSAGILDYPETHFDMVRCGMVLFGLEHTQGEKNMPSEVKTLMTLKSKILKIRMIKTGEYGGYGEQYIAQRDTRVAIVGLGYGDGISRGWKEVLISGSRVPVVNYFMDGIMVDITSIEETVNEFDEAVLIGRQGSEEITWGEVCQILDMYEDEQVQCITDRVPKCYYYE